MLSRCSTMFAHTCFLIDSVDYLIGSSNVVMLGHTIYLMILLFISKFHSFG